MTSPHRRSRLAPALCLAAALACRDSTAPNEQLLARSTLAGIRVTNQTAGPLFFSVLAQQQLVAAVLSPPCRDLDRCDFVPAGDTRLIPWSDARGYAPDRREYLVYSWGLDPKSPMSVASVVR